MALSNDLISEFVKITNDENRNQNDNTVYGTVVKYNGKDYVKFDGSDLLTPVSSTAFVEEGDRVLVTIKNHTATVTGSTSSPSASNKAVQEIGNQISEFEIVIADKVSTKELDAQKGRIDDLVTENVKVKERLTATEADIGELTADNVTIKGSLTAAEADIDKLQTDKLDATVADIKYATVENLESTNATVHNLNADYGDFKVLTTDRLTANDASIKQLQTDKLDAKSAEIKFANVDFSNIGKAAIEEFFAQSGLIQNVVVGDQMVTGQLVGVTISGDLIEGNTIVAEKLVIKGEDGLYYKLNTDGVSTSTEQTDYNSLNGTVIRAKSITAEKVAVDDLVAFDATIGGFSITNNAIYSGAKASVDNTTRGIYLDNTGQIAFGDSSNFLKYYRTSDGSYKLEISAKSIKMSASNTNIEDAITNAQEAADNAVKSVKVEYALSDSSTVAPTRGWSMAAPTWTSGKYMWQKTTTTLVSGEVLPATMTCIQGAKGETGASGKDGEDAVLLQIISSNGQMFKNSSVSTTLAVNIIVGGVLIASSKEMYDRFGNDAYIVWLQKRMGETTFTQIDSSDSRISDNGFLFTINAEDVRLQTVYNCELYY